MKAIHSILAILAAVVLAIAADYGLAGAANAPTTLPAARASSRPAPDPYAAAALAAIENEHLAQFRADLDEKVSDAVVDLTKPDLEALIRLASYREFAGFFGRLQGLSEYDKSTLKWLVQRPQFFATLMMAISDADSPDKVLAVLAGFQSDPPASASVESYPDLAAALCVVWDKSLDDPQKQPDVAPIVRLFHYYTNAEDRGLLRFNLRSQPWQLAVYVVNNKASEQDILWAVAKYRRSAALGHSYFDVPYDTQSFYTGANKQIDSHPYTLPNLNQFGGVCVDQAYYAAQVCRSLGVPACTPSGAGSDGSGGHEWLGYLQSAQGRASWNFTEGRYKEHAYWTGSIEDPQTRELLAEADVAMLAELQNANVRQRLASIALMKLATPTPAGGANQDAEPAGLSAARRLDVDEAAVGMSPGNRGAWMALADMGARGDLSPAQLDSIAKVIARFVLNPYPDFACRLYLTMARGQKPERQLTTLDQCTALLAGRPDLRALIRMTQGDMLHGQKHDDDALRAYGDVLSNNLNAGPVVITAMSRVDAILRQSSDLRRLASIYKFVWTRLPAPEPSAFASTTPYYAIGLKFSQLLLELGDSADAQRVQGRLDALDTRNAGH